MYVTYLRCLEVLGANNNFFSLVISGCFIAYIADHMLTTVEIVCIFCVFIVADCCCTWSPKNSIQEEGFLCIFLWNWELVSILFHSFNQNFIFHIIITTWHLSGQPYYFCIVLAWCMIIMSGSKCEGRGLVIWLVSTSYMFFISTTVMWISDCLHNLHWTSDFQCIHWNTVYQTIHPT